MLLNLYKRTRALIIKIFFPSFVYEYQTPPLSEFIYDKIAERMSFYGGKCIIHEKHQLTFSLPASSIFGKTGKGSLLISIKGHQKSSYNISVEFILLRRIYYGIVISIICLLILNMLKTREISNLFAIPLLLIIGHVIFLGLLPSRVPKIRNFIMSLNELNGEG